MALLSEDISNARALVVEGNPAMRSMLASQLREFGVKTVVQCGRIIDARRHLEYQTFDFVLCELHFHDENASGQDLLDDLRRNQLLPYSTVFVMITGEATYAHVAEAAESALDGYLLKPHKASQLGERLQQARIRKVSLQGIFSAIEEEDFAGACKQCVERFNTRGPFWLYAARIGAELLLRIDQPAEAKKLYEAVIKAKTLPWAKLGVARSMLDGGQITAAVSTLENLIAQDPSYADAYDVMGRAQFELGKFDEALATYKMASKLTPASVGRLQSVGIMAFYAGKPEEAEYALQRTCLVGMDSKLFDYQCLVLMAFLQFERNDHKALQRCVHDFDRLIDKNPETVRLQRLARVVEALTLLQHHKIAQALALVRELASDIREPAFDFESASNLIALLSQMAKRAIQLDEVHTLMDHLALRFCASRAMSELLAGAAHAYPAYAEHVRAGNTKIIKYAEVAMSLSLRGNPTGAVNELIERGQETLNSKLVESAEMVLLRYKEKIGEAPELHARVAALRAQCMVNPMPGQPGTGPRKAGALTLRVGGGPVKKKAAAG
ncbi:response regulator [Rhodoferax lacus]|uniref:Response regulator n=1 Tax=Rhodoferax lacus TaxID=2184758 RepID=A0A3E1RDA8_9BURK|nr:response regulator [Rhodoferax lacus]RFO97354.1 response regulator [Rhodoferax lacus]